MSELRETFVQEVNRLVPTDFRRYSDAGLVYSMGKRLFFLHVVLGREPMSLEMLQEMLRCGVSIMQNIAKIQLLFHHVDTLSFNMWMEAEEENVKIAVFYFNVNKLDGSVFNEPTDLFRNAEQYLGTFVNNKAYMDAIGFRQSAG